MTAPRELALLARRDARVRRSSLRSRFPHRTPGRPSGRDACDRFVSGSSPRLHPLGRSPRAHWREMREAARPLLCELHAHTTWSDGELSLAAVVDLYGTAGFDALCVTDHVLRRDDPWPLKHRRPCVDATNIGAYLAEPRARARPRALDLQRARCAMSAGRPARSADDPRRAAAVGFPGAQRRGTSPRRPRSRLRRFVSSR